MQAGCVPLSKTLSAFAATSHCCVSSSGVVRMRVVCWCECIWASVWSVCKSRLECGNEKLEGGKVKGDRFIEILD